MLFLNENIDNKFDFRDYQDLNSNHGFVGMIKVDDTEYIIKECFRRIYNDALSIEDFCENKQNVLNKILNPINYPPTEHNKKTVIKYACLIIRLLSNQIYRSKEKFALFCNTTPTILNRTIKVLIEDYSCDFSSKFKRERYSFKKIKNKAYKLIIKVIKEKIGVSHDRFDEYSEYLDTQNLRKDIIVKSLNSQETLKQIVSRLNIGNHKKAFKQVQKSMKIVSLALLKCKDYNTLMSFLMDSTALSRDSLYHKISKYISILGEIFHFNVNQWLPSERRSEYTFSEIKNYIENKGWLLIKPKSQSEFDELNKEYSPSNIPLTVYCGNPEHLEWNTRFRILKSKGSNCPDCSNNVVTFSQIEQLVKEVGIMKNNKEGILLKPKNNEMFLNIRRQGIQPSYIPLQVSCGIEGHQIWETNAVNLSNGLWCRECGFDSITKYDFYGIKDLVESRGGKLVYPSNLSDYYISLEQLKGSGKSNNTSPTYLPIKIVCDRDHQFETTPDQVNQNHWCPLCAEKNSVVGRLMHPIFEYLFLKLSSLRGVNARFEEKLISTERKHVDLIITRDENFRNYIEKRQGIVSISPKISSIIIDFTIGTSLNNIYEHCERNYQAEDRLLIIVLLRFESPDDDMKILEFYREGIIKNSKINKNLKNNIKLFSSHQFLDFLNLNRNILSWSNLEKIHKLSKEEINLIKKYEKYLNLINILLDDETFYENMIAKVSRLSEEYKKKLKKF